MTNCGTCGEKLDPDWLACTGCGRFLDDNSNNCVRCFQIIDSNASFCPFCGIGQEIKIQKKLITDPKREEVLLKGGEPFQRHSEDIEKKHIFGSLKFNKNATYHVIEGDKYTKESTLIILLSVFIGTAIYIGAQILFSTEEGDIIDVIKGFIFMAGMQIGILFSIAFFSRNILFSLNYDVTYYNFIRYISLFATVLLIKDLFMLPTVLYIYTFEGTGGGELASGSYAILTILVIAFLLVHFLTLLKNLTGTSNSMSFVILITIVGLSSIFTFYIMGILDAILRM